MYAKPAFVLNISDPATRQPISWIEGVSFTVDTAIHNFYQYGHAVSRFVQAAVLDASLNVSRFVLSKHHRPPGGPREQNLEGIYNMTVGASGVPVVFTAGRPLCVRELVHIPDYERGLWTRQQGQRWRSIVSRALELTWAKCPPPRAVLLTRPASDVPGRIRAITNPHVLHDVARQLGIPRIDNVTIGGANTTRETATFFSSFGLMISTHSSQLKSLLFAAPNAAVVEVVGTFIKPGASSPFEANMAELGVHYHMSRFHTTNLIACRTCLNGNDKDSDVTLNATLLLVALADVLQRQKVECPNMRYA